MNWNSRKFKVFAIAVHGAQNSATCKLILSSCANLIQVQKKRGKKTPGEVKKFESWWNKGGI